MLGKEGPETPLLDLSDAAVKALIRSAKKRGYVTHDRINALLSSEEVKSEQIEIILAKFSEMGVNVIETEEADPENEGAREEPDEEEESEGELVEVKPKLPAKSGAKDPAERTDDPVRMDQGVRLLQQRIIPTTTRKPIAYAHNFCIPITLQHFCRQTQVVFDFFVCWFTMLSPQREQLAVVQQRRFRPMSALGHKQTFAAQRAVSALPPKATLNAYCSYVR